MILPVINFEKYKVDSDGVIYSQIGKPLKFFINWKGYKTYTLYNDNGKFLKLGHRLVAEVFIPNPENKKTVNHIDCNKLNNCVSNLEWTTIKENINHAYKNGLYDAKIKQKQIAVINTNTGIEYNSITLAAKICGISRTHLTRSLNGSVNNHSSFIYKHLL